MNTNTEPQEQVSAGRETKAFLLIAAFAIPLMTLVAIFGYGFLVWIIQIFAGPPSHL